MNEEFLDWSQLLIFFKSIFDGFMKICFLASWAFEKKKF